MNISFAWLEAMVPGLEMGVEEVVVNDEAVNSDAKPLMIYADQKKEGTSAS